MPQFKLLKTIKNVLQLRVVSRHQNHFYFNRSCTGV